MPTRNIRKPGNVRNLRFCTFTQSFNGLISRWYKAKTYQFKRYTTRYCLSCPVKEQCSKAAYRKGIQRSEYQELIELNKNRIKQNTTYYKSRQAIVEHPYGTIKRQWGSCFQRCNTLEIFHDNLI